MRVLIGCEFSGTVRRAFAARGHDAWSCDLRAAEDRSNKHIVGDIREILGDGWDLLMVAHPPCVRLCNSGVRWLSEPPVKLNPEHYTADECRSYLLMNRAERLAFMWGSMDKGARLFSACWNAPIERIAIENPIMHRHAKAKIDRFEPHAQSVQPWQYGHGETKRTCLWLKNLPALVPTNVVSGRTPRVHHMSPGPNRGRERSRFFSGIAEAMADQWGGNAEGARAA